MISMPVGWPSLPYEAWSGTCDTLHAHTQVLGSWPLPCPHPNRSSNTPLYT